MYQELVKTHDPTRMIGIASSAGGQLLLLVLHRARAAGLRLPAVLGLYTPASDVSGVGDSGVSNGTRDVQPFALAIGLIRQNYLGDADALDPEVSPIYAEYGGDFPPTVITTGTRDMLMSNAVRLDWKLREAHVESKLLVTNGGWHGFNWEPSLPEAIRTRQAVYTFLREHLPGLTYTSTEYDPASRCRSE